MAISSMTKPTSPPVSGITPNSSVKSTLETLANAVSELQKTFGELRERVQPVVELSQPVDQAGVEMPSRLSPNACPLCINIDCEAERIERLAGEMYRLTQSIQL